MFRARFALLLFALPLPLLAGPLADEPEKGAAPDPELPAVPVIKLAPQASGPAPRALRYGLLPPLGDLQPGNAATLWVRAGQSARGVSKKLKEEWVFGGGVKLKDLPKNEVREALKPYALALRLSDQAARRDRCDWDLPPLSLTNWDFPLSEISDCRLIAQVLSVRYRLELSEGDFDAAARTLQTGLALARHFGDSDTMIQGLVGIAIAAVMFGLVEEWMQVPGSPNLYWSLTALPVPFIDVRRSMEHELNILYQAIPQVREYRDGVAGPAQVDALVTKLTRLTGELVDREEPQWQARLAVTVLAAKYYPDARRCLLAEGYTAKRLDVMSAVQVVVVYQTEQYDRYRDEVLKLLTLPTWQARAGIEGVTGDVIRLRQANPFITMLFPAVMKVYEARSRSESAVASLRAAEALRLYAAAHDGKAPAQFTDMKAVPLPIDPLTGKGFEGFYTVKDGRGVLAVPSTMPRTPQLGRRFEIGPGR